MSDLSRFFRVGRSLDDPDESKVSSNRSRETDAATRAVLVVLQSLSPAEWSAQTRRPGWTVLDLGVHLAWRVTTDRLARVRRYSSIVASGRILPRDAQRNVAEGSPTDLDSVIDVLRGSLGSRRRRSLADLAEVVITGYDLAASTNRSIEFSPASSGAVAVAHSLTAPTPIKAVVRSRTFIAGDAGWSVGRGKPLTSTAADIVLFLAGRSTEAPREIPLTRGSNGADADGPGTGPGPGPENGPVSPEETTPGA